MQIIDQNEDRPRGTYEFPFEFHHIDANHPRYIMSYHWHVEYEIIRILSGEPTGTSDDRGAERRAAFEHQRRGTVDGTDGREPVIHYPDE